MTPENTCTQCYYYIASCMFSKIMDPVNIYVNESPMHERLMFLPLTEGVFVFLP